MLREGNSNQRFLFASQSDFAELLVLAIPGVSLQTKSADRQIAQTLFIHVNNKRFNRFLYGSSPDPNQRPPRPFYPLTNLDSKFLA